VQIDKFSYKILDLLEW